MPEAHLSTLPTLHAHTHTHIPRAYTYSQDRRYYNEIELSDLVQPGTHEDRIALTLSDRAGAAVNAATAGAGGATDEDGEGEGGAGGGGEENSLRKQFEKAERVRRVVRGVANEWEGRLADVSTGVVSLHGAEVDELVTAFYSGRARLPSSTKADPIPSRTSFCPPSSVSSRSTRVRSATRCAT